MKMMNNKIDILLITKTMNKANSLFKMYFLLFIFQLED